MGNNLKILQNQINELKKNEDQFKAARKKL